MIDASSSVEISKSGERDVPNSKLLVGGLLDTVISSNESDGGTFVKPIRNFFANEAKLAKASGLTMIRASFSKFEADPVSQTMSGELNKEWPDAIFFSGPKASEHYASFLKRADSLISFGFARWAQEHRY